MGLTIWLMIFLYTCDAINLGEVWGAFHLSLLPLSCILALLYELCLYLSLAAPQTLLLRVKWICLNDVHCVHTHVEPLQICSLRYKDIKKALKIFFGMAGIKGPTAIELKKFPLLHLSQNLILFDQRVEVEISHSLYSLKFSFFWLFKFFIAVK